MHHILPKDIAQSLDDISAPRLSTYRAFFAPKDDASLYGIYCWNDAISNRLMQLFGIIEVTLRNRVHKALSRHTWNPGVSLGHQDSNDWYNYVTLNPTSEKNIKKVTHRRNGTVIVPPVSPNKVVSSMTFGFWPRMLDLRSDQSGTPIPWDALIPSVVPGHHQTSQTYWNNQHRQDMLFARMDLVGDLRNRVAHFEPVWKLNALKSEWRTRAAPVPPVIDEFPAPVSPAEAIDRLQLLYKRSTQLLHWLSKVRAADYMLSENHHTLTWLLSEEALIRYQNLAGNDAIRLSSLSKPWGLKMVLREKKAVTVTDKKRIVGRFYPSVTR